MGRPPCCDKIGVKKGPWTPEEDIMLVTHVQEHGPGNWRAVPTNTGLRRCSKSCRLRWTNYLRPGIKRGCFTDHEEKMIIQLQALLGNKWAAIASYIPERTDNDIKNYWNTHLKKKLKKLQNGSGTDQPSIDVGFSSHSISRGQWERRLQADIHTAKQALHQALSPDHHQETTSPRTHLPDPSINGFSSYVKPQQTFSYASSTENIAKLLKQWVKKTPKSEESCKSFSSTHETSGSSTGHQEICTPSTESKSGLELFEAFDSLIGLESFEPSNSDDFSRSASPSLVHGETKPDPDTDTGLAPFSVVDNWLLDDQGKDILANFSFDENPTDLFK